ncbi:MAG: vitamin B12 dependent-methionine synthase activation domain-containing protein [Candidatus Omnitrophota bacterium]|nr:vitamin B12 dependent-methionine synthase activation domain-containing protein [Candidatus Omnitrophota bacterium]
MPDKNDLGIDWGQVKGLLLKSEKIPSKSKNRIMTCVKACLKEAVSLADPKHIALEKSILNNKSGSIELEGAVTLSSGYLYSNLKGATHVNILLVTLGKDLEDAASKWMKDGDELRGYLLDRIGSLAVEALAEKIEGRLREKYGHDNRSVSMRFSPGYCDWPIEEQFELAKAADFSSIGVTLTKDCVMVPRKSISAVVGIGPKGLFLKKRPQCAICDMSDCAYRRGPV